MLRKLWHGIGRVVFWDYPRAGWQYDVMVGLILAFIFLTPRGWFRDQPRPTTIVMLEGHEGSDVLYLAPELLHGLTPAQRIQKASALISQKQGRKIEIVRLDPILDAESEVTGYMAVVKR
jgi:hypothetical protein